MFGSLCGQARDVHGAVPSRCEKVGMYNDMLGTLANTGSKRLCNGGLGQFHMGVLDDSANALARQPRYLYEHIVRVGMLRSMIDKNDSGLLFIKYHALTSVMYSSCSLALLSDAKEGARNRKRNRNS